MNIKPELLLETWELMTEFVPTAKKEDAVNKLIKIFEDYDLDTEELASIRGEDHALDAAIDALIGESEHEEDY